MSSWEAQDGKRTDYIQIQGGQVVIGNHFGSGHTDNAGVASFEQVLRGEWDAHIKRHFPGGTLAAVKAAIRGAAPEPEQGIRRKLRSKRHPKTDPAASTDDWEDFD